MSDPPIPPYDDYPETQVVPVPIEPPKEEKSNPFLDPSIVGDVWVWRKRTPTVN